MTSPVTNSTPAGNRSRDAFGRTRRRSSWRGARAATTRRPRNPVAPVTRIFTRSALPARCVAADFRIRARFGEEIAQRHVHSALRRPVEPPEPRRVAAETRHVDRPQLLRILLAADGQTRQGDQALEQLGYRMVLATGEIENRSRLRILREPLEGLDCIFDVNEVAAGREVAHLEHRIGAVLDGGELRRKARQREIRRLAGADEVERAHDRGASGEREPLGSRLGQCIGRARRDLAIFGYRLRRVRYETVDLGARHEQNRTGSSGSQDVLDTQHVDREVVRNPPPRLAHVGKRCEVHDAVGSEARDDIRHRRGIADIDCESRLRCRDHVLVDRHGAHSMPRRREPRHQPPPHETGRAGDEDAKATRSGRGRLPGRQPRPTSARCAGASSSAGLRASARRESSAPNRYRRETSSSRR